MKRYPSLSTTWVTISVRTDTTHVTESGRRQKQNSDMYFIRIFQEYGSWTIPSFHDIINDRARNDTVQLYSMSFMMTISEVVTHTSKLFANYSSIKTFRFILVRIFPNDHLFLMILEKKSSFARNTYFVKIMKKYLFDILTQSWLEIRTEGLVVEFRLDRRQNIMEIFLPHIRFHTLTCHRSSFT